MANDRCPWGVNLAEMLRIIVMSNMSLLLKKIPSFTTIDNMVVVAITLSFRG